MANTDDKCLSSVLDESKGLNTETSWDCVRVTVQGWVRIGFAGWLKITGVELGNAGI